MINSATQHYIEELQTDTNIVGIILFGSWARGNNRADSDVDLLIIVRDGFKRTVEYDQGQAFEITYTTEQGAIDYWQSNPDDAVELWSIAKVLFDRDGTASRLQQVGEQIQQAGKAPLATDQYAHHKFDTYDQLQAIKVLADNDRFTASMLLASKLVQLTELFFDTRELWTPPPKQRLGVINDRNPALYTLITRYYDTHTLHDQIALVHAIADIVFDRDQR